MAKTFCLQLKRIYDALLLCKGFKFDSASLLLVYDAATSNPNDPLVKLIDFEKVTELDAGEVDADTLEGVGNLCTIMELICDSSDSFDGSSLS